MRLVLALSLVFAAVAAAQAPVPPPPPRALAVPYIPTADTVVATMLTMARVTKRDVVYDLGSGDGRIVIAAATQYGARGVGIDIDPVRVAEANDNARKAGVTHLVRFVEGDIFAADITAATVVTMYLLPEINLRLRPKLLADLKPGTRIVSHNYDLGDWAPLETRWVAVPGVVEPHRVYFWVIPPRR